MPSHQSLVGAGGPLPAGPHSAWSSEAHSRGGPGASRVPAPGRLPCDRLADPPPPLPAQRQVLATGPNCTRFRTQDGPFLPEHSPRVRERGTGQPVCVHVRVRACEGSGRCRPSGLSCGAVGCGVSPLQRDPRSVLPAHCRPCSCFVWVHVFSPFQVDPVPSGHWGASPRGPGPQASRSHGPPNPG